MGRRKERRLAAMSAGRRVKLDLFAEPSGDLGDSSTQDGVGGDGDSKNLAEFPNSPTSSGKQTQNPLILLEQYSDEELDDDLNEVHNDTIAEDASIGMDEQSKAVTAKKAGPAETNNTKDSKEVEELLMDNSVASKSPSQKPQKESIGVIDSHDLLNQTNKMIESAKSVALEEKFVGGMSSGWKMVLHEESNQYYYWNVMTGETSWEAPEVFAQPTVEMSEEKAAGEMDADMGTNQSSEPLGTTEDDLTRQFSFHTKFDAETNDCVDLRTKDDGSNDGCGSDTFKVEEHRDETHDQGTSLLGGHSVGNDNDTDLSLQLIKQFENLLERLNSLKGLDHCREGQDLKSKCSFEIEIRLADIKTLSSYESCLLPFWLHSEVQLNRLEADVDRAIQQVYPASRGGYGTALDLREGIGNDADIGYSEPKTFATGDSHVVENTEKLILEANNDGVTTISYSSAHPGDDMSKDGEITGTEKGSELNPKQALDSMEDVDMDVDMEVEDTSSIKSPHTSASGANCHISVDPLGVQSTLLSEEPKLPRQVGVPPDEEWIPPPPPEAEPLPPLPPDDEPFPPPPPDEPPETSYPPSDLNSIQAIPYSGGYALPYPSSTLEYYVQTNPEVSVSTFYPLSEGAQLPPSHASHYYEAGPNVYPVAPTIVNPVEPTPYYELRNGTANPASLMHNTAESSGAKGEPASGQTGAAGSLDSCLEAGSILLPKSVNVDKSLHSTAIATSDVPEGRDSPATSSVTSVAPVPSSSDADAVSSSAASAIAAAAAAAMKSQPKASRTKKRAVAVVSTLRSNKKVSSLVDKWKAAKEELHEELEEPEDAYEILEKKRQREIEKWHANQIASGEAKDNANFQPLGGDWRERVKRRRAEKMKESGKSSSEVCEDRKEQPDLIQLSKSLPSGWQAYWDESSKKVYYGNVLTSVTMWTRPTE